jgi:hypothetical protein
MEDRKMRKKVLFLCTLYIASLSLILTGCKTNEPEQPAKVQTYHVSIQAGKGDANQQNGPRKALGLDGTTLTASWKTGEQVSVRNVTKSTDLTGFLVAQSNGVQTIISGDLTGTINAGDELLLRFLSPDYTNQQGTLEYLELHCDYAEATIHVASVTWGSITFEESIADFHNRQAIAKFTLMNEAKDAALAASDLKVEVDNNAYNIHVDPATSEIFVALPGFTDKTIKLTATVGSDTYTYTSPSAKSFEDGKYYAVTVGLAKKVLGFSIDPTHQIEFAHGNLQYKASENKWRIAENQYDFVGTYYTAHFFSGSKGYFEDPAIGNVYEGGVKCNNTNESIGDVMSTDCWIDLFGWNTWNKPLLVSADPADFATDQSSFTDWGHNTIYDTKSGTEYTPDTWRTPTMDEWMYIIGGRTNAQYLCGLASIDDPTYGNVKGLILLPDEFVKPDGITFHHMTDPSTNYHLAYQGLGVNEVYQGASNTYPNTIYDRPNPIDATIFNNYLNAALEDDHYLYNQNRYTVSQWEQLEAAGAVFLPAAGWTQIRWVSSYDHSLGVWALPHFENFLGAYWSSNYWVNEDASYLLISYQNGGHVGHASQPFITGQSVRLVRDL